MTNTASASPPDLQAAARRLASAWRSQQWLDALPDSERPRTLEEAYAIQRLLQAERGVQAAGWKMAGASASALRSAADGMPVFGFLCASRVLPSGASLPSPSQGVLTLELELAVRFAREAVPSRMAFEPALVDAVFLAFEVVRSRFHDRKTVGRPSLVADDVGFHAFVHGDVLAEGLASTDLFAPATIHHAGQVPGQPLAGDDRVDLRKALELFWQHAAAHQWTLPAATIVTTGVIATAVDVDRPGLYEGRLGRYTVRIDAR